MKKMSHFLSLPAKFVNIIIEWSEARHDVACCYEMEILVLKALPGCAMFYQSLRTGTRTTEAHKTHLVTFIPLATRGQY